MPSYVYISISLLFSEQVKHVEVDYTNCVPATGGEPCANLINDPSTIATVPTCTCSVPVTVPEDITGEVRMAVCRVWEGERMAEEVDNDFGAKLTLCSKGIRQTFEWMGERAGGNCSRQRHGASLGACANKHSRVTCTDMCRRVLSGLDLRAKATRCVLWGAYR